MGGLLCLLEVFGNSLKLLDKLPDFFGHHFRGGLHAVVDVILDQLLLGVTQRLLYRVQLLGQLHARPARLEHLDHPRQVSLGTLEPRGYLGKLVHPPYLIKISYPTGQDTPNRIACEASPAPEGPFNWTVAVAA